MDLKALNASKLEMFKAAIDKQADNEINSVTKKIRDRKSAVGKARAELAVREELSKIRAEQSASEARFKKELSRCDFEIEMAVRIHRKELIEVFFEEIEGELREFAKSSKYDEFLKSSLKKAEEELGAGCVILAREADLNRLSALTKNEVKEERSIRLGGICAKNEEKGLFSDYTLDSALKEEKEAFSSHPELRL